MNWVLRTTGLSAKVPLPLPASQSSFVTRTISVPIGDKMRGVRLMSVAECPDDGATCTKENVQRLMKPVREAMGEYGTNRFVHSNFGWTPAMALFDYKNSAGEFSLNPDAYHATFTLDEDDPLLSGEMSRDQVVERLSNYYLMLVETSLKRREKLISSFAKRALNRQQMARDGYNAERHEQAVQKLAWLKRLKYPGWVAHKHDQAIKAVKDKLNEEQGKLRGVRATYPDLAAVDEKEEELAGLKAQGAEAWAIEQAETELAALKDAVTLPLSAIRSLRKLVIEVNRLRAEVDRLKAMNFQEQSETYGHGHRLELSRLVRLVDHHLRQKAAAYTFTIEGYIKKGIASDLDMRRYAAQMAAVAAFAKKYFNIEIALAGGTTELGLPRRGVRR